MPAVYGVGQEVIIKPVKEKSLSVREAALGPYAGQSGKITDYYWIEPPTGGVFYLYMVQVGQDKEIVLYEDEITHLTKPRSRGARDRQSANGA